MRSVCEIEGRAAFDRIRYGQCWEDADVLLAGLDIDAGDTCLSVASAGDNTLAIAGAGAGRVIAVDLSAAQIACLELRIAAIGNLEHSGLPGLARPAAASGPRGTVPAMPAGPFGTQPRISGTRTSPSCGVALHGAENSNGTWRCFGALSCHWCKVGPISTCSLATMTKRSGGRSIRPAGTTVAGAWPGRLFFDRRLLGRFGRDPGFTRYADETVWQSLERRIPHALTVLSPKANPYLQWILKGRFETALPWSWRPENFERIREQPCCNRDSARTP